jgi:opacity protein-like surface antigen
MKRFLLGTVLLLSIASSASVAQDTLSTNNSRRVKDAWTMEFGIASNFTLSTFQGTAISVSRYISDYQKIRIGISTSLTSSTNTRQELNFYADTLANKSNLNDNNGFNTVQLTLQYLTYASPAEQISIYFAFGPVAGITWSSYDNQQEFTNVWWNYSKNNSGEKQKQYSVGLLGSCGVEWFFSERMSLHAEYALSIQYNWENYEVTSKGQTTYINNPPSPSNRTERTISSHSWSLQPRYVLFGLSVIF